MKTYKNFMRASLGESDIARVLVSGCNPDALFHIKFGSDGGYNAYLIPEMCEIGKHYALEARISTGCWFKVYDDETRVLAVRGNFEEIEVYRAGEMGCVIRLINGSDNLDDIKTDGCVYPTY